MAKARKTGKAKSHAKAGKGKSAAKADARPSKVTPTEVVALEVTERTEQTPAAASLPQKIIVAASLRSWNVWLAAMHALEGLAILVLSATHTFPVTVSHLAADPVASDLAGHPVLSAATKHVFDVNMALLVAACFFLSAIAHALAAFWYRGQYEGDLQRRFNKLRWIEFGVSASTIFVILGLLSGVADLTTLLAMIAFGLIAGASGITMDYCRRSEGGSTRLLINGIGALAGFMPWLVIALYAWAAGVYGSHVPNFVYWIYGTIFLFFCAAAANVYLQYKEKGRWADYLYGERVYMILGLAVKTALAWQIFAGTLHS